MSAQRWLTVDETAAHARRHPDTVRRAARSGELEGHQRPTRSGKGHWRFRVEAVDRWLAGELGAVVVPIDRRRRA